MKKHLLTLSLLLLLVIILIILQYNGFIWHNSIFASKYPIHGLDVSHHQGKIDWPKVAENGKYSFVYMKATEGHDFIDRRFQENWQGARNVGLKVGAYHFFSMRSPGKYQAEYFSQLVPVEPDTLPPALDIEISTKYDPGIVRVEIDNWIKEIEKKYGRKPVLYVTTHTYDAYIRGHFMDYPIWIRDIITPPSLPDRQWAIWQYSNRGRVEGISNFVDKNALSGELQNLVR